MATVRSRTRQDKADDIDSDLTIYENSDTEVNKDTPVGPYTKLKPSLKLMNKGKKRLGDAPGFLSASNLAQ